MFGDLGSSLLERNGVDLLCNYPSVVEQFSNGNDGTYVYSD